ncbi:MAG: NlpC/P60 family protein [Anaerovoracaceae bacterium]
MLEICRSHASTVHGKIRLGLCISVIFVVAMVFGLLILAKPYAVYATGEKVAEPWVVKVDGKEVAIIESKDAGEQVLTGLRTAYCSSVVDQQKANIDNNVVVEKYRFEESSTHPVVMTTPEAVSHVLALNEGPHAPIQIENTEVVTDEVVIPYTQESIESDRYFEGETALWSAGVDGSKTVVSEVTKINGVEVQRKELKSTVNVEAIPEVTMVGTVAKPAAPVASTSSSNSSSSSSASSSASKTGNAVVDYGLQFLGTPYVWGGTSLTGGIDCSGFTMQVYAKFGVSLPHSSYAQRSSGRGVSYSEAQPGDLICYNGHVALYMGNGKIVHANGYGRGIQVSDATYNTIVAVRRVL